MTRSTAVIKAELAQLADQAKAICNDKTSPTSTLKGKLDRLEPMINAAVAELAEVKSMDEQRRRTFGGIDPMDMGGTAPLSGQYLDGTKAFGVKGRPGQAPPVAFAEDQLRELYDGLVSGKSVTIEAKATTDSTGAPMASIPDYRLPPVAYRREPTRVLDLIPSSATDRAEVDYYTVTTPASAAGAVAEGADKPESTLAYAKQVAAIRKIAHYVRLTDETLSDYPKFLTVVQEELLAGLILQENNQLLNGTGVAPNISGMLTATGILVQARGTDTRNDALMKAITALRTGSSFSKATGVVMNPADYQTTVLEKDTQGRYIAGDPRTMPSYDLWGLPVTLTTQIAAGTALVGAFPEAAEAFIRWGVRIEANSFGTAEWIANKTLIRCEERLGLAVLRPASLCKVTGL